MELEPQITFLGMDPSPAVEKRLLEQIAKLEEVHNRIISCRVTVSAPHRHSQKGKIFAVALDIGVPKGEVVVSREPGKNHAHEDIYVAIRDAFDAAQRQLQDHVRKHSGYRVKEHPGKTHGKVDRLFPVEGYGFIRTDDGREFYFGRDNVTGESWDDIKIGAQVRFTELDGDKGLHAAAVSIVS